MGAAEAPLGSGGRDMKGRRTFQLPISTHLYPAASLPLGASTPPAAPLPVGGGQLLAALLGKGPPGSGHAGHFAVPVSFPAGRGTL